MKKSSYEYLLNLPAVSDKINYVPARTAAMNHAVNAIELDGIVCEFGVQAGDSAKHLISLLSPETQIYLFDSFEGLPEDWCGLRKKGRYKVDVIPEFKEENVHVIKGWFEDTLPEFDFKEQISLAHIDCDIYSATKTVFDNINKYLKKGSILLFDEYYNYKYFVDHEFKAFHEFVFKYNRDYEYIGRSLAGQVIIRMRQ